MLPESEEVQLDLQNTVPSRSRSGDMTVLRVKESGKAEKIRILHRPSASVG